MVDVNADTDIVLHLDYRERGLFDELKSKIEESRLKLIPLDVGDILFKVNDTAVLILERKTQSDLISSITDGRFRNQKERLTMSGLPVCYLIEDERGKRTCDKKERMYRGSLVNLIFCHKFNVLHTKSVGDTANYLFDIYNKIKSGKITFGTSDTFGKIPDAQLVSKSKAGSNVPPIVSQLSLIRGVSVNMAKTIAEVYSTPKDLILALNEGGENLLATIMYGSKKIGKAISKRIYETYIGSDA